LHHKSKKFKKPKKNLGLKKLGFSDQFSSPGFSVHDSQVWEIVKCSRAANVIIEQTTTKPSCAVQTSESYATSSAETSAPSVSTQQALQSLQQCTHVYSP